MPDRIVRVRTEKGRSLLEELLEPDDHIAERPKDFENTVSAISSTVCGIGLRQPVRLTLTRYPSMRPMCAKCMHIMNSQAEAFKP